MSKRLAAFVPAVLVGGVLLLTACGQGGSVAESPQQTSTGPASTMVSSKANGLSSANDARPVECGTVEVDTVTHILVADGTPAGVVGCTEAYNIVDEYLKAPSVPGDPFQTKKLSGTWTCSKDDGEFAAIDCKNDAGLTFHTEEPAK
jgi:hypothetical protein